MYELYATGLKLIFEVKKCCHIKDITSTIRVDGIYFYY
jgi:hypothetical protein